MAATHDVTKTPELGGFGSGTARKKAARFLIAVLASLAAYVVTGFLLLGFFIGTLAGGTGPGEWTDTGRRVFLATLAVHALAVAIGSAWLARLFKAPVLPVLLSTAAILASPWAVGTITASLPATSPFVLSLRPAILDPL